MILVTGCTGQVGSSLIRQLLRNGIKADEIRGMVRHPGQTKDPAFPREVELFRGDIADPQALPAAMEGVTQVIHLVGILVETGLQTFQRIHVEGTRHLVQAAKNAGVNRFIAVSALGTRPMARSTYHQTKWQAEKLIRHSDLNFTIFRPSVIFGPLDGFTNAFATMARFSPVVPLLGKGMTRMQPVWVEDVVHCLIQALKDPSTHGETLEIGGPEQLTFRQIMETILDILGKRRLKLPIPFSMLTPQAWILERIMARPPLTVDQMIMAQEDNILLHPFPWERFGRSPRTLREGLEEYL
ncbi:MAG: complex I NDUFA9 subunit family protein [Magnetococcales bacterium]|nr:complex I NDUFA9 subunit family protein [Magnetococcales bacterium]MBF0437732.1 complex I NDUFA9 subunit family protein [Magnetococcales bacterium]